MGERIFAKSSQRTGKTVTFPILLIEVLNEQRYPLLFATIYVLLKQN